MEFIFFYFSLLSIIFRLMFQDFNRISWRLALLLPVYSFSSLFICFLVSVSFSFHYSLLTTCLESLLTWYKHLHWILQRDFWKFWKPLCLLLLVWNSRSGSILPELRFQSIQLSWSLYLNFACESFNSLRRSGNRTMASSCLGPCRCQDLHRGFVWWPGSFQNFWILFVLLYLFSKYHGRAVVRKGFHWAAGHECL